MKLKTQPFHIAAAVLAALLAACGQEAATPQLARNDLAAEESSMAAAASPSAVDVAIAEAEDRYQIEIQRCEALAGTERETCLEQARSQLDAAKDAAQGFTDPTQPK